MAVDQSRKGRVVSGARSRSPVAPAVRSQMMRSIRKVDTGPERSETPSPSGRSY
jgi:hypothetical protein